MDDEIKLDETQINFLMSKIIMMENLNLKTRTKNDQQMIEDIKKTIEEAIRCCSNQ